MKSILLLAAAFFLISAPAPDSATIAEMTANFIVPTDEFALQASELPASEQQATFSADAEQKDEVAEPGSQPAPD